MSDLANGAVAAQAVSGVTNRDRYASLTEMKALLSALQFEAFRGELLR